MSDHFIQLNSQAQFNKIILYRLMKGNSIAFFLQFSGLTISMLVPTYSFLWFAGGTTAALCFLKGPRILPGIFLGSFFAYFLSSTQFFLSCMLATLNVLQAFILLKLAYAQGSPIPFLYPRKMWLTFTLYIAIVTALISASMGLLCYPYLDHSTFSKINLIVNWWLANFNGTLIFYIIIITCDIYFPELDLVTKKNKLMLSFHSLILILMLLILVSSTSPLLIALLTPAIFLYAYVNFLFLEVFGLMFVCFLIGFFLSMSSFANTSLWQTHFSLFTLFYLQILLTVFTFMTMSKSMNRLATKFNNFS